MLKRLRAIAPGIEIDILAVNEVRDLTRREADIAIRHGRPEQPDLIARLVGETTAHLYASPDYLDRYGRPDTPADLSDADFIGFEHPERLLPILNPFGLSLTGRNVKLLTESGTVMLALMQHGLGIGMLTKNDATLMPGLEPVLPEVVSIPVPIWLVTHRELHTSRRIRLVYDLLAEELAKA